MYVCLCIYTHTCGTFSYGSGLRVFKENSLGPYGPGPFWAPRALVGPPWALIGLALINRALMGPARPLWAGPLWAPPEPLLWARPLWAGTLWPPWALMGRGLMGLPGP